MSVQELTAVFTVSVVVMYAIRLYLWRRWLFYIVFIALAYQFYPWSFLPLLNVWWREMFYGVIIALGYQFYSWWRDSYSTSGRNNHDHLKFKHQTRPGAQAEVDRMRRRGYKDSEWLNVYYNADLKGWFVIGGWNGRYCDSDY